MIAAFQTFKKSRSGDIAIYTFTNFYLAARSHLSIPLLAAIVEKLISPKGGLPVGKWDVHDEEAPWNDAYVSYMTK